MKCSQDAVLQAAAVLAAAKISNGLGERGADGPDIGATLSLSILDVLDGINEFNSSEQGAALRTWDDPAS